MQRSRRRLARRGGWWGLQAVALFVAVSAGAGGQAQEVAGVRSHANAMASGFGGSKGGGRLVNKLESEGGDRASVWNGPREATGGGAEVGGAGGGGGLFGFNPSGFVVKQASSSELLRQLKLEARAHEARQSNREFRKVKREVDKDLSVKTAQGPRVSQQTLMQQVSGWGYQGSVDPAHWGDVAPECSSGKKQSPIAIQTSLAEPIGSDIALISLLDWHSSPVDEERQKLTVGGAKNRGTRIFLSLPVNSRFKVGGR
eukprot:CAMPEP_0169443238 /NCGR_PEP_ID=MMETSP1042-20121227/9250_1 /TAXON_ID=464988 /ORGANISM="Hemiselmis andersenii, Strain CCMP1180" /LENGTH=256 /DNA_ID=CAMNT_0009554455 /DNA_START=264 /DNA_END=1030 /DNA_ORIENTATION=-